MKDQEEHSIILKLIDSKFNELSKTQAAQNALLIKEMKFGFKEINNRIDCVVEQKQLQNGRILKLENKYDILDKHTKVWQFIQRRPYISAAIGLVFTVGLLYVSKNFTVTDVLKILIH